MYVFVALGEKLFLACATYLLFHSARSSIFKSEVFSY